MDVGVLWRFRENKIAFMTDYVLPSNGIKEHRYYLKCIWWKDGDYISPIIEYQINVHVFGGILSLGCSKYALRTTSTEYKDVYGLQVLETLQPNFYVYHILNYVKAKSKPQN